MTDDSSSSSFQQQQHRRRVTATNAAVSSSSEPSFISSSSSDDDDDDESGLTSTNENDNTCNDDSYYYSSNPDATMMAPLVNYDDDDDDILFDSRRNNRRPLELSNLDTYYIPTTTTTTTWLGDTWRLIASLGLASFIALLLFVGGHNNNTTSSTTTINNKPWPSDALECAKTLNISFSETFYRVQSLLSDNQQHLLCSSTQQHVPPPKHACRCHNPTLPLHYKQELASYRKSWDQAFARNIDMMNSKNNPPPLDLILLGDSITEHFVGSDLFHTENGRWKGVQEEFQRIFSNEADSLRGLPLGIAGDGCSQLAYRISHGEVPNNNLQPPLLFWIEIGTNDLTDFCSAESVLSGIIGIQRMLQQQQNMNSMVVINSILPRGGGEYGKNEGHLWEQISWINERLRCYAAAAEEENTFFFDATSLFTQDDYPDHVDLTLLGDYLHPTAKGARIWLEEMRKQTLVLTGREDMINSTNQQQGGEASSIADSTLAPEKTHATESNTPAPSSWPPGDDLACSKQLNISFSETSFERLRASSVCSNTVEPARCRCQNPLLPAHYKVDNPAYQQSWDKTMERNEQLAHLSSGKDLDVVFLGDSITEFFLGTNLGQTLPKLEPVRDVFDEFFQNTGLPLGISGDGVSQLLYRIEHGEIPDTLSPSIWWIEIGTNDLTSYCTSESILLGIITVARRLQQLRPGSTIVINSILPRGGGTNIQQSIHWINERLSCYCDTMQGVHYFDATSLFLTSDNSLNKTLLPDSLHPSAEGARVWLTEVVKVIKELTSNK